MWAIGDVILVGAQQFGSFYLRSFKTVDLLQLSIQEELFMMRTTVELNDGQKMPVLGIGTFTGFDADKPMTTSEAVTYALKVGYRHIDCAYAHNNETDIGIAIRNGIHALNIKR